MRLLAGAVRPAIKGCDRLAHSSRDEAGAFCSSGAANLADENDVHRSADRSQTGQDVNKAAAQ